MSAALEDHVSSTGQVVPCAFVQVLLIFCIFDAYLWYMEITKRHVSCVFRNSHWSIHGDVWASSCRDLGPRRHSTGLSASVCIAAAYSGREPPPKRTFL